jgi:hypothetical protein
MARSLKELKSMSDDDLVLAHDRLAEHTQEGIQYYLAELDRRGQSRLNRTMLILNAIALIVALISLAVSILNIN